MSMLSNPAFGPRVALIYVTVGALMDVWVAVYYFSFVRGHAATADGSHDPDRVKFWLLGLFLTGLTLVILGMLLGPLGRAARKAELPPADATAAEANIQQNAASHPQPVVAGGMAAPGMAPGMMPGMNPAAPQGNMNMVPGAVPQVPGAPNGPQGPNPYARQY